MKKNFVKYLILLVLTIFPCIWLCSACKDDEGTESFISIHESVEESETMESVSDEISEESSIEEASDTTSEEVAEDSAEKIPEEDSSVELPEDDDLDAPQDDFPEGGIQGESHHFVTDSALPDCENDGFYKEWCDKCDVVVEEYTISALGHLPITVDGFAPTCNAVGATEYIYCERCEVTLTPSEEIPCIPHDFLSGSGSCIWCDKIGRAHV